jgi:hypothetical protein
MFISCVIPCGTLIEIKIYLLTLYLYPVYKGAKILHNTYNIITHEMNMKIIVYIILTIKLLYIFAGEAIMFKNIKNYYFQCAKYT